MIKKNIKLTILRTLIASITNFFNKFKLKNLKYPKSSYSNLILISVISMFFLYLIYLSIPSFYKNDLNELLTEDLEKSFNQDLSLPKNVKYSIIPAPHFTFSNVKFFNDDETNISNFAEIKELKVFISQKNLFKKSFIKPKYIVVKEGNFYFNKKNLKKLDFIFQSKLHSKIIIKKSNLFFKNQDKELISLLGSKNIQLNIDKKNKKNLITLVGKIFNTPIKIESVIDYLSKNNETSILLKDLKLKIKNTSSYNKSYSSYSEIKSFRTILNNNLKIDNNKLSLKSIDSNFQLVPVDYSIDIELDPFSFNSEISIEKININKLGSPIIIEDLVKNFILENEVINGEIKLKIKDIKNNKLIDHLYILLDLNSGKIFFKETYFKIKKIGYLNILSNNFELVDDRLSFRGNFNLDIENEKNFYKKFMVPKKNRFSLENIKINCQYNFATSKFYIKNIVFNDDVKNIVEFQYEEITNWATFKKLIQKSTKTYSG